MKSLIISIFLYALSFYLITYSRGAIDFKIIATLLLIAIIVTLLFSVWFKGNFRQRQIDASKIAFPTTAIIFLLGYFFQTFKVMI